MRLRTVALLVGALGAVLFAAFVWPTQYKYMVVRYAEGPVGTRTVTARISRFSGKIEYLTDVGWLDASAPPQIPGLDPRITLPR